MVTQRLGHLVRTNLAMVVPAPRAAVVVEILLIGASRAGLPAAATHRSMHLQQSLSMLTMHHHPWMVLMSQPDMPLHLTHRSLRRR